MIGVYFLSWFTDYKQYIFIMVYYELGFYYIFCIYDGCQDFYYLFFCLCDYLDYFFIGYLAFLGSGACKGFKALYIALWLI